MFSSIRWRTAAIFVVLTLVCIGGLSTYLSHFFRNSYLDNLETQLANQAWLVADGSSSHLVEDDADFIDDLAKNWGEGIGARVTIISLNGTVLGDSEEDPSRMENHSDRPEVMRALSAGLGVNIRYSETLGFDMMYVAVPVVEDGDTVGIARVSLPLTVIDGYIGHINITIIWVSILAAVIVVLLSIQMSKITIEPVKKLTQMSRRIAEGDLDQEIETASRGEVGELATAFNLMASKLKEMVSMITIERDRMAVILANMGDGIIVVAREGRVVTANEAALKLFQLSKGEVEGHSLAEAVRDYELNEIVQRCLETGEQESGPVEIDRTRQFVLAIATPLGDEGGCLLLMQNLTELRRLENVRRDFVANISHELRLPIASVKALAETLYDGAIDDPSVGRDFLQKINAEVDRLTQMVQELGELSSIESSDAPLAKSPFDLEGLIRDLAERLRPQADRAGVALNVDISGGLPEVTADSERIGQALVNLAHNAIKFTPPGGTVTLSAVQEGNVIRVSISDTGVGITADDLPRIFERFYKADKSRSGGGTGLGLAIVKHIIEAHGGRVWAESTAGKGSTFHFILPLEP